MIARKNLIPLRQKWPQIIKESQRVETPLFTLLINKAIKDSQWAIVVSKKIDKRSVIRHQIKRKVAREVEKLIKNGVLGETVILVKDGTIKASDKEIYETLTTYCS